MTGPRERLRSRNRRILSACLAVSALFVTLHASAAVTTLTSQNSTMNFDFSSSAGLTDWLVDGTDQANQQWFWYRIGSGGPQFDLSQISSPVITPNINGRQLRVLYANSSYGVQIDYTLAGQAAGSGKSGLTETVRVFNYGTSPLDFHLFMYSDLQLGGPTQSGNQYVNMVRNDGVGDSLAVQSLGNFGIGTNSFTALTLANLVEAANFPQTRNALTTSPGYSLNNTPNAGPGHVTWALEWDMTVGGSSSIPLSLLDNLAVPEPSVGALGLVGLCLFAWRRARVKA